jgi:hypothetical protein
MKRSLPFAAAVPLAVAFLVFGGYVGASAASGQAAVTPLATDCSNTALALHNGFQVAPACAETSIGEVPAEANGASLLISEAPKKVRQGDDIILKVSTRNILRDRFLAAGQGGYYAETSLLTEDGIVRGHFHAGCRVLDDGVNAPTPQRSPVFKAVEDGGGSKVPDTVTVTFAGKDAAGNAIFKKGQDLQCAAWTGDGSHRIATMQFANQIPGFDSVRVQVKGDGGNGKREDKDEKEGKQR